MKITVHLLVLIISFFFNLEICVPQVAQSKPADRKNVKRLAIDFHATNLNGQPFQGKSLKGKIVLLDFWAVWCRPCIAAFPTLKKLNQDLKKENFEVVGVALYSGTYKDVGPFAEKHELDYKSLVGDAELAERFDVIGFPTYFLIAPNGTIHKKYVGEAKNLFLDVKKEVEKLNKSKTR